MKLPMDMFILWLPYILLKYLTAFMIVSATCSPNFSSRIIPNYFPK